LQGGGYEPPGPPGRPAPLPVFLYRVSRCQSSPAATACASPAVLGPLWTPSTIIVIIIWPPSSRQVILSPGAANSRPLPFLRIWALALACSGLAPHCQCQCHPGQAAPHPQPAPNLTYILRGSSTTTIIPPPPPYCGETS